MSDADLGAVGDRLRWVAEDLEQSSLRMQRAVDAAQCRSYEASSPDDLVQVTVDGRSRVSAVRLSPRLSRADSEHLDAALTATLNDALDSSRAGSKAALLDALPAGLLSAPGPPLRAQRFPLPRIPAPGLRSDLLPPSRSPQPVDQQRPE